MSPPENWSTVNASPRERKGKAFAVISLPFLTKWASEEASPCGDEAVEVQVAGAGGGGEAWKGALGTRCPTPILIPAVAAGGHSTSLASNATKLH